MQNYLRIILGEKKILFTTLLAKCDQLKSYSFIQDFFF